MTVNDIIPNEDASPNDWSTACGTPHYDCINEDKGSPICGTDKVGTGAAMIDDNDLENFGFTTLDNIQAHSITQVKVWTYGNTADIIGPGRPEIAVSWDGGSNFTSYEECLLPVSSAWTSNTWSGLSYSKSDLDLFQVSYRADTPGFFDWNIICCVYVEVTYTEVTGYTHKFNGVLPASIGKISGVATANINKVKGA